MDGWKDGCGRGDGHGGCSGGDGHRGGAAGGVDARGSGGGDDDGRGGGRVRTTKEQRNGKKANKTNH